VDELPAESPLTVVEMVEALCLFNEPILNSRYHGMLLRRARQPERDELAKLPALVLEGERYGRQGAVAWMRQDPLFPDASFTGWAERTVLEGFLTLAEAQLRVVAHIARSAPTLESRAHFDRMTAAHRNVVRFLRQAVRESTAMESQMSVGGRRNVQEEAPHGDLRGQLEDALQKVYEHGNGVREILLSHVGLRHLRDQGCFQGGDPTFRGHPVVVDLGWDAPAFVIETWDVVPLEEIMGVDGAPKEP
jgi:hypothetical protein